MANCYLILRLSSLGNVAMSVPVVYSVSKAYPDDHFVIVCEKRLAALFYGMENVSTYSMEKAKKQERRQQKKSLWNLYKELRTAYPVTQVVDLQDNRKTRLLRWLFRLQGIPATVIDNERFLKHKLCFRGAKQATALTPEAIRYQKTFARAGLKAEIQFDGLPINKEAKEQVEKLFGKKQGRRIGIAPFAKCRTNRLPYQISKEVILHYAQQADTQIFLFGAGKVESEMLGHWAAVFPNTHSIAGILSLSEELELMRTLDIMICMDSANQHLAVLVSLPTMSIWCGTHPYSGYGAWGQNDTNRLQKGLSCRPCTINGKNQCRYQNFLCKDFTAEEIVRKAEEQLTVV